MPLLTTQPFTYGLDASIPRFSLAKYQRMVEEGILTSDDKVELLENYLVLKMPRSPKHDSVIQRLQKWLFRTLPEGWDLRIQSAISLIDSQPEPDLAIVRGDGTHYECQHPTPDDIELLIEVADSSLLRDQRDKARIYARSQIAQYWILNLVDRRVEVFRNPSGATSDPGYADLQLFEPASQIPLVLDRVNRGSLTVSDFLS